MFQNMKLKMYVVIQKSKTSRKKNDYFQQFCFAIISN